MAPKRHFLSDIDLHTQTARCLVCGPVSIRVRTQGAAPRCRNALRAEEQRREVRREPRQGKSWKERGIVFTATEYDTLLTQQGGVCAICKVAPDNQRKLAVDHCHQTGRVRGLLCTACNVALGYLQDNTERLQRAIQYLQEPESTQRKAAG